MSRLVVGDRVRIKGVKPNSPEYDTGEIVGTTFDQAKVRWSTADTIYREDWAQLERVPDNEPGQRKPRSRR